MPAETKEFSAVAVFDAPAATVTVHLKTADGKTAAHILKLGKASNNAAKSHDRYALVDKSDAVIVLPGPTPSTGSPARIGNVCTMSVTRLDAEFESALTLSSSRAIHPSRVSKAGMSAPPRSAASTARRSQR